MKTNPTSGSETVIFEGARLAKEIIYLKFSIMHNLLNLRKILSLKCDSIPSITVYFAQHMDTYVDIQNIIQSFLLNPLNINTLF